MIPKLIHQTAPALPNQLAANVEDLRARNPGWEHRLYDDADIERFIAATYGREMLQVYRRINPAYGAARADFFRYLVVYAVGGVYLDIKSSAQLPLDCIVAPFDRYVLTVWPNGPGEPFQGWGFHAELPECRRGEFQNWHVIAEPRHPFLEHVIAHVIDNIACYDGARVGDVGVWGTTGPIAYSRAIAPLLSAHAHRLAGTHLDAGLVYNVLSDREMGAHRAFFGVHYSALREPLVLPPLKAA
jgi:mannosyltransferase OCH1-like enzyme